MCARFVSELYEPCKQQSFGIARKMLWLFQSFQTVCNDLNRLKIMVVYTACEVFWWGDSVPVDGRNLSQIAVGAGEVAWEPMTGPPVCP